MAVFLRNKTYELNFISLSVLWYVESPRFISTLIPTPVYCFGSLMHEGGFRNWNLPGIYSCMFYPSLVLQALFSSQLLFFFFLSLLLTHRFFSKNFITKGSRMHWNTAGKQGSCSPILNFPSLLCNLNCLSFLSAAPSMHAPNKTYGNMKGGALPSLSSRDHLPGLAAATPGLCYVSHKSSSCFTSALPHLSVGLICQAELPGKFFCGVKETACYKLHCLSPPLILPPSFLQWAPLMPSDVADSWGRGGFILFSPRCWPLHVLIKMLPQFCNSKQNGSLPSRLILKSIHAAEAPCRSW